MAIWVPYYTYVHTYVTYSPASPYVVLVVCTHTHLKTNMYTGACLANTVYTKIHIYGTDAWAMHAHCEHHIYLFARLAS
jgi:hypothetical protein